jgi:methylated-DNA-[protein]-cysteine S-methyltransferase
MILTASRARAEFSEVVDRAEFRGERTVVDRHGRHAAAVVPIADLDRLPPRSSSRRQGRRGADTAVFYSIADLPRLGPVLFAASGAGLCRLSFGRAPRSLEDRLHDEIPDALPGDTRALRTAHRELSEYVAGRRRRFRVAIDPTAYRTPFLRRVLLGATCDIPFGSVRTYGEIAAAVGNPAAARAVGAALASNPVSIVVPCHRVVAAGGRIGGYSGGNEGTGLRWKRELLKIEGVAIPGAR